MTRKQARPRAAIAVRHLLAGIVFSGLSALPSLAHAQLDGHGPDAWEVHGVAANDVLNARMGPGTDYPVIETFAPNEGGLRQITCVPFFTMAHFSAFTEAEIDNLPPRWCLMQSADMSRAGWVSARYLIGEGYEPVGDTQPPPAEPGDALIAEAQDLVRALYEAAYLATLGGPHPLEHENAINYFSSDVVAAMRAQPPGADPIYGAQDFQGSVSEPQPDPDQPMFRGMITLNVKIVNFGRAHTAVFRLRADPSQPGAPIRIIRIEHDGWSFP